MSISNQLINQVVNSAKARGLDQVDLARAAGIAPETLSRAKKRASIDLSTLNSLASAAGLRLELTSKTQVQASSLVNTSELAHPSRGLAWSNPNISNEALVSNALIKRSFELILQAALEYGSDFVRQQWDGMLRDPSIRLSIGAKKDVERMLLNIEIGEKNAASRY